MKRFTLCSSALRTIPWAIFCALVFTCAMATGAFAQHAGGHVGGAGHVSAPPTAHPAVSRPGAPVRPPLVIPPTRGILVRPPLSPVPVTSQFVIGYPFPRRPIAPRRPIFPIVPVPPYGFGLYGVPFIGFGFGWGFGAGLWGGCDPFWTGGYGCYGSPSYDYGSVFSPYSLGPGNPQPQPQFEIQNWPIFYGEPNSQFVQLYLNDGTVYNVTDYWLVNGELHFKMIEENDTKVTEHTIDFSQLDLQKTIDVNTDRGFRFVLRNEPLEQYLRDHPLSDSPDQAPADQRPAEPRQPSPQEPAPNR